MHTGIQCRVNDGVLLQSQGRRLQNEGQIAHGQRATSRFRLALQMLVAPLPELHQRIHVTRITTTEGGDAQRFGHRLEHDLLHSPEDFHAVPFRWPRRRSGSGCNRRFASSSPLWHGGAQSSGHSVVRSTNGAFTSCGTALREGSESMHVSWRCCGRHSRNWCTQRWCLREYLYRERIACTFRCDDSGEPLINLETAPVALIAPCVHWSTLALSPEPRFSFPCFPTSPVLVMCLNFATSAPFPPHLNFPHLPL